MFCDQKELKNLFHRIGGALLMFLALFNVLLSPASLLQQTLVAKFPTSTMIYVFTDLLCSLAYTVSFAFPAIFFYLISKNKKTQPMPLSLRLNEKQPVLSTLSIVFLGTAVCFACSYVNSILFPIPESTYDLLMTSDLDRGYKLVLSFISTAIVPAFVEELLFRGMVLSNIRPYSESGAILISALFFGLMHQTPFQIFYTTALGVVLGIICVKTGSIWSCVLLHFFNNFFSVLQTYLLEIYDIKTGNLIYSVIMCVIIGLGILLGAIFYIASLRKQSQQAIDTLGVYGKAGKSYCDNRLRVSHSELVKAFVSPTIVIYVAMCMVNIIYYACILYMI